MQSIGYAEEQIERAEEQIERAKEDINRAVEKRNIRLSKLLGREPVRIWNGTEVVQRS